MSLPSVYKESPVDLNSTNGGTGTLRSHSLVAASHSHRRR